MGWDGSGGLWQRRAMAAEGMAALGMAALGMAALEGGERAFDGMRLSLREQRYPWSPWEGRGGRGCDLLGVYMPTANSAGITDGCLNGGRRGSKAASKRLRAKGCEQKAASQGCEQGCWLEATLAAEVPTGGGAGGTICVGQTHVRVGAGGAVGKGVAHGDRPMGLPWRSSRTEAPALERAPTYTWRACAPRGSGLMAEPLPRSLACGSARKWIPRGDDEEIRTSLWAVRGGCRRAWAVTSSGRPLPSRPHGAAQVGHVHVMCTHHVLVLVLVDADMCNRHVQSPCAIAMCMRRRAYRGERRVARWLGARGPLGRGARQCTVPHALTPAVATGEAGGKRLSAHAHFLYVGGVRRCAVGDCVVVATHAWVHARGAARCSHGCSD